MDWIGQYTDPWWALVDNFISLSSIKARSFLIKWSSFCKGLRSMELTKQKIVAIETGHCQNRVSLRALSLALGLFSTLFHYSPSCFYLGPFFLFRTLIAPPIVTFLACQHSLASRQWNPTLTPPPFQLTDFPQRTFHDLSQSELLLFIAISYILRKTELLFVRHTGHDALF